MRQQTQIATTARYYTIPLRSPNGAPPKYVAVPMSANDQRKKQPQQPLTTEPELKSQTPKKSQATKTSPMPKTTPKPNSVQRRARSVPLQEMREAVIDIQANARRGGGHDNHRRDDSSCSTSPKTSDMPADDLHFLKYWEM